MADTTYQEIPIAQLRESPLNPRKHFDVEKLKELTASILANGIHTPLLVRPVNAHFEIGAGHRRYRAARAAGVDVVPALVRPMTDEQFLELLNFENLEREDIHPLEEADGYRILMQKAGHSVESIAARVGKSVKYVYDRVKLLALTPEVRKLFLENRITAGHAILLARLSPKDQARAIDPNEMALFQHENLLWGPDEDERRAAKREDPLLGKKATSVRELQGWIDQHVRFDRASVDPMLFPETVATVTAATEKAEKVVQVTHNYHVQDEARDPKERIYGPMSWKDARKKPCAETITGVIVVGPGRGEAIKVCIDKECKTHWAAEIRERAKRAVSRAGVGSGRQANTSWQREQAKREAERAREEAEGERWKKARPQILEAIAAAIKKAPTKATGLLGSIVLEAFSLNYGHKDYSADYMPRGISADDLIRHCAFRVLMDELQEYAAPREFLKRAKGFNVDVRKIVNEVCPVAKPKAAEADKKPKAKK